jgi:hypothetical protein
MTARLRDLVLDRIKDVLERHTAAIATEIAELVDEEIEARAADRIADLRTQLEQGESDGKH